MDLLHIATKLKKLRLAQEMTVAKLAEKSGFSNAFISRVENFRMNPSLNSLAKIADALGISMSELFNESDAGPEFVFSKMDEGESLVRDDSDKYGMRYFSLAYSKIDRKMNPFVIEYEKSESARPMLMHDDDEFFLLLEGEVDFIISDFSNRRRMIPGDTVYLSKNIPHTVELPESTLQAKALVVYSG
jgi:transcriptional regulator with XRE-family HTH domain